MAKSEEPDFSNWSDAELDDYVKKAGDVSFEDLGAPTGPTEKKLPPPEDPNHPGRQALEGMSRVDKLRAGAGARMMDRYQGIKQGLMQGAHALPWRPFEKELDALTTDIASRRELDAPLRQDPWGAAGGVGADFMMTAPFGISTIPRGAMLGGALAFTEPMEEPYEFGARLLQTGKGAGVGALGMFGERAATKAINTARNRWHPRYLKDVDEYARDQGLTLVPGDFMGDRSGSYAREHFSEYLPFTGRRNQLKRQAEQLRDMLIKPGAKPHEVRNVIADDVLGTLQKRQDANEVLWNNLGRELSRLPHVARNVDASLTQDALRDVVRRFRTLVNKIDDEDVKDSILDFVDPNRSPIMGFNQLRDIQKKIGRLQASAGSQFAKTGAGGDFYRELSGLYGKIHDDLTLWGHRLSATKDDAAYTAFKNALDDSRENVYPFLEHPVVAKLRTGRYDDQPEALWQDLTNPRLETQNKVLYQLMAQTDPESVKNMHVLRLAKRPLSALMAGAQGPVSTAAKTLEAFVAPGKTAMAGAGGRGLTLLGEKPWFKRAYFSDPALARGTKLQPWLPHASAGALGVLTPQVIGDEYE